MPQLVEAGAHHLWLTAQAVRILDARAILVRLADFALDEQRSVDRSRIRLAAVAAHRVDASVERRIAAEARIDGQRAGDERGGDGTLGGKKSGKRQRRGDLRPVEQREPFLRAQRHRREARAARALRAPA